MTKTVLLYGDSIFWGVNAKTGFRHDKENRVDTVVRSRLGSDVEVISEGHRGRTMFGENGRFAERNGLDQFGPIFASHLPIDVVVIMLGTNDLNDKTRHSADDIAGAISDYQEKMEYWTDFMGYAQPQIVIVSPPDIEEKSLVKFAEIFAGSALLVGPTVDALQAYCIEKGHVCIDSRNVARSINTDGIHLDAGESKKLGSAIAEKVQEIINRV